MYKTPEKFIEPEAVKEFHKDSEKLGMLQDNDNWYITPEWVECFKEHKNKIEILALNGDPWAQYNLGNIYFCGYLYSSLEEFTKHYEKDALTGSEWLEKAARQGFVAAVDNLAVLGTSKEAERLREISKEVEKENPEFIQKSKDNENIPIIMPSFFEKVWEIAYSKNS